MPLAENISERLAYKFYSSGLIESNSEPTASVNPGASGAQTLRFVSQNLSPTRENYQSNEKRTDRQIVGFSLGTKRVPGTISGLLSPATYKDFIEAAFRGTWAVAVTSDQTDFTSIAADNTTSKFTFVSGNPVTKGFRVGHIVVVAGASDADNNKQYVITGFGGTQNREVSVYPAPDTMGADTSFTFNQVGKSVIVPSSNHISRKVAIESYQTDLDEAELFTECRVGGLSFSLPATGNATIDIPLMGRNRLLYENTAAPFFTNPTVETVTDLCSSVNGLLRVNGQNMGTVTSLSIRLDISPQGPGVVGQNFVPEVFLGSAMVTGEFSAFYEDGSLIEAFDDEDEIQLLAYLKSSNAADPESMTILLPSILITGAQKTDDGSGGRIVQYSFQALRYTTESTGIETTTIQISDSEA